MSQLIELDNTTVINKPELAVVWAYSGVDKSWTRSNNPANQSFCEMVSKFYLPKGVFPDDVSIRWKVGDISAPSKTMGFCDWDGRFRGINEDKPNILGVYQANTQINFYVMDQSEGAFPGGTLPGGLTLAVDDELRVQILKVSGDYVAYLKWRRPPGGAEQILDTASLTNTQLIELLRDKELWFRFTGSGNATVTNSIFKEVQAEVTDAGADWLIVPDELGTAEQAPIDLYEDGSQTFLESHAGEYPEETLPIPTEGQLYPLGDGREFIE